MTTSLKTERSTLKRLAKRGSYEREHIEAILDDGYVCHVGFTVDGKPVVIPTAYVRDGSTIYLHGSVANRMLRSLVSGGQACVTVTHLDGLVLARSAFHHSMNYRSVVLFGKAVEVEGAAKSRALSLLVDRMAAGRSAEVRGPNESELRQTMVIAFPIHEASAKIRTGPALDDEEDYALAVWAGVVPLELCAREPIADDRLKEGVVTPANVARLVVSAS